MSTSATRNGGDAACGSSHESSNMKFLKRLLGLYEFFPPTRVVDEKPGNANAQHNLLGIRIFEGLKYFYAILAQERWEWFFKRKWEIITLAPLLGLIWFVFSFEDPVTTYIASFGAFMATMIGTHVGPYGHWIGRRMEIRGKLTETLYAVAYNGADYDKYIRSEAGSLVFYDQFKGWDVDEIEAEMRRVHDAGWKTPKRHKDHTDDPPYPVK